MWTREALKTRAKERMSFNYWRCVLVAVIAVLLIGGGYLGSGTAAGARHGGMVGDYEYGLHDGREALEDARDVFADLGGSWDSEMMVGVLVIMLVVFLVVFAVVFAVSLLLNCFLFHPLSVGCKRFFYQNLNEKAQVKEICFNFDYCYLNGVKVMFFRWLYQFLWTLLFIIPGIVKSYEYRMIPYILAEQPDIDKDAAFAISRQMMDGHKWNAFVLDLSFIGWQLLSVVTVGIVGILYVNPYVEQTDAAFYEVLKRNYKQMEQTQ